MACRLRSRWPTQSTVARRRSGCTPALRPTTAREPPVVRATRVQRWSCRLLEIETEIEIEAESIPAPLRAGLHAAGTWSSHLRFTTSPRPAPAPCPNSTKRRTCNFQQGASGDIWQVVAAGVSERLSLKIGRVERFYYIAHNCTNAVTPTPSHGARVSSSKSSGAFGSASPRRRPCDRDFAGGATRPTRTNERASHSHNGGSPDHLQGYGSVRCQRPAGGGDHRGAS